MAGLGRRSGAVRLVDPRRCVAELRPRPSSNKTEAVPIYRGFRAAAWNVACCRRQLSDV